MKHTNFGSTGTNRTEFKVWEVMNGIKE